MNSPNPSSTPLSRPRRSTAAPYSNIVRRSFHQSQREDNQMRRMSSWAVFGAVMDQEDFCRSMSEESRLPRGRTSTMPHSNRPLSRLTSPGHPIQEEPDTFLSFEYPQSVHSYTSASSISPAESRRTSSPSGKLSILWLYLLSKASTLKNILPTSFRSNFRNILKCSIAYLIASLFSFYDPLSDLLVLPFGLDGPFSGAHVIATIVTYYRPAATVGAMMQANHYALWGLIWLAVMIVGSTMTAVLIHNRIISHAIVLLVFVGFGFGTMNWVKQKSPGFASTCSMIGVISSVIITREGSIHYGYIDFEKSLIYSEIIFIGMFISNLVCLGFWRGSATTRLQNDIDKTLDSFSTLLGMLTKTFLLDESIYTDQESLMESIDRHHASFTSLKSSLDAASYEFFEPRIQRSQASYQELIASMNRLAQHLTGLRSGCGLQYELMEAARHQSHGNRDTDTQSMLSNLTNQEPLGPVKEVFTAFCETVGPSLKTLMATGTACFHEIKGSGRKMKPTYSSANPADIEPGESIDALMHMRSQLQQVLETFQDVHSSAMNRLFEDFATSSHVNSTAHPDDQSDPFADVAGTLEPNPNEEIFLMYFFLFNMEEFMGELCHLLDIFADIRADEEALEYETRKRWRQLYQRLDFSNLFRVQPGNTSETRPKPRARQLRPKLTAVLPQDPKKLRPFPATYSGKQAGEQNRAFANSSFDRIKRVLYDFFQSLGDPDMKTAIKVGGGAAVMTLPAFLDVTRPLFHKYRGQWAIVTYVIVMASTLGQTNFLSVMRVIGTLLGSGFAILAYHLFWENPVALPIIGFMFSLPCYWLIVTQPAHASTGRFVLLSYNLVCVYSYNVRDDNVHILVTAYRRVVCVLVGVVFGWIVNNFVWPYKARRELRTCLSEFLLESAFLYSFLVKRYSETPEPSGHSEHSESDSTFTASKSINVNECVPLLLDVPKEGHSDICEFSNMELFLQVKLNRLLELLSATKHEPRLKGAFPTGRYRAMLTSCQQLLDMLHSMWAVTNREAWRTSVRPRFVLPAQAERRTMVGNVLLLFGLLSTAIELKSPMPPFLPPAEQARERLLGRVRAISDTDHSQNDFLFFAYAVAMKNVIRQLENIAREAQGLYGIIGGVRSIQEFESFFATP
ncbi:Fusaric acid resistance protein-like-domain-containing protein [Melampsora americana]|nr:Fusaric acid resistance protein-like-domain-containing protein [Melampsora americana]